MTGEKHATFENFSAGVLIIWGIFTMSPFDTSFATNPKLYGAMLFLANSQIFWGLLFFALGWFGVLLNYRNRQLAAIVMGVIYVFFTSLFFFGDFASRAWAYYGWIALYNLMHYSGFKRGK